MFGTRIVIKRGSKEEAEKPFWISFSDLMSALMVLFLIIMSVALLAVTKRVSEEERAKVQREKEIAELLGRVQSAANEFDGVRVDGQSINFGKQANFEYGSYQLAPDRAILLRAFIPKVLAIANDPLGRKWFKRIVVEGFTDQRGSYLFNLNLSLLRSQRVLCVLLAVPTASTEVPLTDVQKEQIRDLFLVGGYSFNSAKKTPEESRRIELRLEFLGMGEAPDTHEGIPRGDFGSCSI
jgi:outer membrane protein OmpA-like peptidoglycan-associated protein